MTPEPIFSRRVLTGWIVAGLLTFLASLYFMTRDDGTNPGNDAIGPSTFSRSAIGHAGFAEILRNLGIPVVQSQYDSAEKLSAGSVLVIAEPLPMLQTLEALHPLLDAKTVLLILPKRSGSPSEARPEWLGKAETLPDGLATSVLRYVVPQGEIKRQPTVDHWTKNELGPVPTLGAPAQLMVSDQLRPIIATDAGMLLGALKKGDRRLWVLSDPDVIANHGIAKPGNAELGVALIDALRGDGGRVVFDETIHGFVAQPASPLKLLFTFPYVLATFQGVLAIGLLLWATLARFGAPEPVAPPLKAGKLGLIETAAKLLEFAGHQKLVLRRYVETTIRDVAGQLHAPPGLGEAPLMEWLRRIAQARAIASDGGEISRRAADLATATGADPGAEAAIARDIHRWKEEMLNGPAGNSRQR